MCWLIGYSWWILSSVKTSEPGGRWSAVHSRRKVSLVSCIALALSWCLARCGSWGNQSMSLLGKACGASVEQVYYLLNCPNFKHYLQELS